MTSLSAAAVPPSLVQEAREDVWQGTKHGWEETAFDGLFESHLSPSARLVGQPANEVAQIGSARTTESEAAAPTPDGLQRDGGPVPGGRSSPGLADARDEVQGWSGVAEVGSAATSAPEYSGEDARAADVSDAPREAQYSDTSLPEQVVVSAVSDGAIEIYVRDGALDGDADSKLGRAIRELLDRHRLTLGRVKLNGHELGVDGESGA